MIAALRATMDARGVALPPNHFGDPDVELARYAVTVGLLTAQSEEDRCACKCAAVLLAAGPQCRPVQLPAAVCRRPSPWLLPNCN